MKDEIKEIVGNLIDLQDRIRELEAINEEHRKINGNLRYTKEKVNERNIVLNAYVKDVEDRIDKAIEYIEKYSSISGYYFNSKYNRENDCLDVKERLLNILQGSDE